MPNKGTQTVAGLNEAMKLYNGRSDSTAQSFRERFGQDWDSEETKEQIQLDEDFNAEYDKWAKENVGNFFSDQIQNSPDDKKLIEKGFFEGQGEGAGKSLAYSPLIDAIAAARNGGDPHAVMDRYFKDLSAGAVAAINSVYPGMGSTLAPIIEYVTEFQNNVTSGVFNLFGVKKKVDLSQFAGTCRIERPKGRGQWGDQEEVSSNCAATVDLFGSTDLQQKVYNLLYNFNFNPLSAGQNINLYPSQNNERHWETVWYNMYYYAYAGNNAIKQGSIKDRWEFLVKDSANGASSFTNTLITLAAYRKEKGPDYYREAVHGANRYSYKGKQGGTALMLELSDSQRTLKRDWVQDANKYRYDFINQLCTGIIQPDGPNAGQYIAHSNMEAVIWLKYYFDSCINYVQTGKINKPFTEIYADGVFKAANGDYLLLEPFFRYITEILIETYEDATALRTKRGITFFPFPLIKNGIYAG